MSKIPSVAVPSDDCAVDHNGVTYHPHEGETVWLWPDHSLAMLAAMGQLNQLQVRIAAVKGEPNEISEAIRIADETFRGIAEQIAPALERWDWTDMRGQPLPALDGTVGPLMRLSVEELMWLSSAVRGETGGARKNGSKPSRTTS